MSYFNRNKRRAMLLVLPALILGFLGLWYGLPERHNFPARLSGPERELLTPPEGVPRVGQEMESRYAQVLKLAQDTQELEIEDCFGSPVVARVAEGSRLTIRNKDAVGRTLGFRYFQQEVRSLSLLPGSEQTIPVDFHVAGAKFYVYTCNIPAAGPAGYLVITPAP